MSAPDEILAKATPVATYTHRFSKNEVPCTFQPDGPLVDAEEVTFNLVGLDGDDLTEWVDDDNVAIKFTATKMRPITLFAPLHLSIAKTETASAFGVKKAE